MRRFLLFAVLLAAFAAPAAAQAATIVVTTAEPTSATNCTLTSAIDAANAGAPSGKCVPEGVGPAYRIEFALPSLPATITPEVALPSEPKLRIHADIEIAGPGASQLTISGGSESRVFEVQSGNVVFANLTIAEGKAGELGAGIIVRPAATVELFRATVRNNETVGEQPIAEGGGIGNEGALTLVESTVSGNTAKNISTETKREAVGAGIGSNSGSVVLERSTISGNNAILTASSGESNAGGAGVFTTLSSLTVRDSTVSGNHATANGTNLAVGAGIFLEPFGPQQSTIERSTIVGNTATGATSQGGGLAGRAAAATVVSSTIADNAAASGSNAFFEGGTTGFVSTIVARPVGGANCAGTGAITSSGYNLDEGSSCKFLQATDQTNINPGLATNLEANGGPTATLALLNGSPAVDHGISSLGESTDQRGLRRPVEIPSVPNAVGVDGADVGAYEVQVPRVEITRGPREGETIEDSQPSFEFSADGSASGFICTVDGASTPCGSPFRTGPLANGGHTFTVAAIGEAGYAGESASRSFTVEVKSAPVEPTPPPTAKPKKAPQTKINGLPSKTTKVRLKIKFSANQSGSTFQCKLDKAKWRNCRSPYKTPKLKLGKHVFKVKAKGPSGLVDQTPATKSFRVVAPAQ